MNGIGNFKFHLPNITAEKKKKYFAHLFHEPGVQEQEGWTSSMRPSLCKTFGVVGVILEKSHMHFCKLAGVLEFMHTYRTAYSFINSPTNNKTSSF